MARNISWHDFEKFSHMAGFHDGLKLLEEKGKVKWTNTATDMSTGGVHGLRYKVEKTGENSLDIVLQHWVRWPNGEMPAEEKRKKHESDFLVLKAELQKNEDGSQKIRPVKARWMGRDYDNPSEFVKLMFLLQGVSEEIRGNIARNTESRTLNDSGAFPRLQRKVRQTMQRDEIPNIYDLAKRSGVHMPSSLEGMFFNGEFNFRPAKGQDEVQRFPKSMTHAMLGIEEDGLRHDYKDFSRTVSLPNLDAGDYEGATYHYTAQDNDGDKNGFDLSLRLWSGQEEGSGKTQTEFYHVSFRPDPENKSQFILKDMQVLGYRPDLSQQKGVSRALRAMKYINLAMRRGEPPVFSDILNQHDLKTFLRTPPMPDNPPENPRTILQVFGANMDAAFTEKEKGIGSNGLVMIRDFQKDGEWVKQGIGVDWGVTFGDTEKDYYNTISHNYGRYLTHKTAPHIKPYADMIVNVETHEHEDHLRGVVKFAKFGYNIPPMIMNQHTQNVLKRMMQEERVPKDRIDGILTQCHVVNVNEDVNKEDPEQRKTIRYGDTVIEQWTEVIPSSEDEGENKYFPVMEVYKKDHPESRTKIRVGPAGHSAHALMFEIGGVLYTGDYKMDQTIDKGIRTDIDWLRQCRDAAIHVQECTNATKTVPYNTSVAEVKENRKEILRDAGGKRILYDTIGSNAIDIEMFCRAVGEVRAEPEMAENKVRQPYEYVIFAGAAIQNKYRDLNETHDFKQRMNREYGIKTVHIGSKKAKELLADPEASYAVIMSGTQDEAMSVTHRVSRDLHDSIRLRRGDIIIRGQGVIPVGNNFEIRQKQNARYRHDFGCTVYDAHEMGDAGKPIYVTSHASQDDVRQVHDLTGGKLKKMLFHGGPDQIESMHRILQEYGAPSLIPDKQALYEVDYKAKDVKIIGETPEERVGYREIRADKEEFFNKHRQQATVKRVKDRWHGDVAAKMYVFEDHAARREEGRLLQTSSDRGVNLAHDFNEAAGSTDFPPVGIYHPDIRRPYYTKHKNIRMMVGMDAETTGANVATDVHTDISFVATDLDGNVQKEVKYKHRLPKYKMASVGALAVTGNDDPQTLHRGGLHLRKFLWKTLSVYKNMVPELTKDPEARGLFYGYRSNVFDDQITMRMMGSGLVSNDMKPMATYGNVQLDVYNLYAAMIALMPDKVGTKKDQDGNFIRTLEVACKKNGVPYDKAEAHGSLYDAQRVMLLLNRFKKKAPDIFEQMVMNSDFSASRPSPMIDHILGQDLHLNDQAPLFGYVDPRDRQCKPAIGALVTIDTEKSRATDAIVLNMAKADVHHLEQLDDDKLLQAMNDPKGPFAVVRLNNSPCMFPPQMVYDNPKARRMAVGRVPKSTLLKRADALKKMRDESHNVGNNFVQRVQRLYPESALCRRPSAHWNAKARPQVKELRMPNERIFSLFALMNNTNAIKNRHYRAAGKLLRDLQPTDAEFKPGFDREGFWKDAIKRARQISEESGRSNQNIEDMRFLIEWHVHDLNPKWLPEEERRHMNALKSVMVNGAENAHSMTASRFLRELNELEQDKESFGRMIGHGRKAQKRWKIFKKACLEYAGHMEKSRQYKLTDAKRDEIRHHQRHGRPYNMG